MTVNYLCFDDLIKKKGDPVFRIIAALIAHSGKVTLQKINMAILPDRILKIGFN